MYTLFGKHPQNGCERKDESLKASVFIAMCIAYSFASFGQATNRQDVSLEKSSAIPLSGEPPNGFMMKIEREFLDQAVHLFEEEMHPLRSGFWFLERDRHWREWERGESEDNSRPDFAGRKAEDMFGLVGESFGYALREATVDLPIVLWAENMEENIGRLFEGSIGYTMEERVDPLDSQYSPVDRKWWNKVLLDGMTYGVRPFSDRPYAYVGFKPWRLNETDVLVHLRYYPRDLESHSVEAAVSFILPSQCFIDLGAHYEIVGEDDEHGIVAKLHKNFGKKSSLFISGKINEHSSVFAGFHSSF